MDTWHWLREQLARGPVPKTELFARAKEQGYYADQIRWALDCLNATEVEVDGHTCWRLPEPAATE